MEYKGIVKALRSINGSEGVRGLTKGLLPTLFRDVPFSGNIKSDFYFIY